MEKSNNFASGAWNNFHPGEEGEFQFRFGNGTNGTARVQWAWGIDVNHVVTTKAKVFVKADNGYSGKCGSLIKFSIFEGTNSDNWPGWAQAKSQKGKPVNGNDFSLIAEDSCNKVSIEPGKFFMITVKVLCDLGSSQGVGWEEAYKAGERYLGPFYSSPPANFPRIITQSTPDKILGMNDTCEIKWEPFDNTVSSLKVSLRDSMGVILAEKSFTQKTDTTFTYDLSKGERHRGANLQATLEIIPATNYGPGAPQQITLGRINTLPSMPEIKQTGILVDGTNNVILSLEGSYDQDLQPISYQYTMESSLHPKWQPCEKIITFTLQDRDFPGKIKIPFNINGLQVVRFRSFDGLEGSDEAICQFNVKQAPRIENVNYTFLPANGQLIRECHISFQLTEDIINPKILVQVATMTNEGKEDWHKITNFHYEGYDHTKLIRIKIEDIPTSIINYGQTLRFRVLVSNDSGYSTPSQPSEIKRRGFLPQNIVIESISNDGKNKFAKKNYFSKKIKISASLPQQLDGYAAIQKVILLIRRNNGEIIEFPNFWTVGDNNLPISRINLYTDPLEKILPNETIVLGFQIIDQLLQSTTFFYEGYTFIRTNNVEKESIIAKINPMFFKPLSESKEMEVVYTTPQSTGSTGFLTSYIISRPVYELNETSTDQYVLKEAEDYSVNISQPGQTKIKITGRKVNGILNYIFPSTSDRIREHQKTQFIIQATDGFGSIIKTIVWFNCDYGESPYFDKATLSLFSVWHDYDTNPNKILSTIKADALEVPTYVISNPDSTSLDIRMTNYKEKILLKFPRAIDPNNDIVKYEIFVSRDPFSTMAEVPNAEIASFDSAPWDTIEISNLQELNNGFNDPSYYYYYLNVPQTVKNESCWFKIEAVDSGSKRSNAIYSNTFILNCRAIEPLYNIKDFKIQQQGNQVLFTGQLHIIDLGGSSITEQWDPNFYQKYRNFERKISYKGINYIPKFKLKVSIDTNFNFAYDDPYLRETYLEGQIIEGENLLDKLNSQQIGVTFDNMPTNGTRLYVKTQLFISIGFNLNETDSYLKNLSYVQSLPNTITYLGNTPTVSHRSHCIGINSNSFEDSDLFTIQSYGPRDKIKLMGTVPNEIGNMEILIDLKTGRISGAIISGGAWS